MFLAQFPILLNYKQMYDLLDVEIHEDFDHCYQKGYQVHLQSFSPKIAMSMLARRFTARQDAPFTFPIHARSMLCLISLISIRPSIARSRG